MRIDFRIAATLGKIGGVSIVKNRLADLSDADVTADAWPGYVRRAVNRVTTSPPHTEERRCAVSSQCLARSHFPGRFSTAHSPRAKFPPDSLVNVHAIAHGTPVLQVIGTMRNFTSYLGVRCTYCHVGEEGKPLTEYNFVSDDKRAKVLARQMMFMVQEINRRLDSLPAGLGAKLQVTCNTCHRGTTRPLPLSTLVADAATAAGTDSAVKAYRGLRERYYGRDAYDFGEGSLNTAAFRLEAAQRSSTKRSRSSSSMKSSIPVPLGCMCFAATSIS